MELKSSLNYGTQPDLNGYYDTGNGAAALSDSQQLYKITGRKKSKVRLNDQLIPKPTDINMAEKMIKIATPKEHPYSSHISRFAIFPSYRSPDDPETGVRAASQPFPNPLIPNSAPDITLLSKTIGSPYRHEVLATPMKTRKKAVTWSGEHGYLDHSKPLKEENQVFYPTPPKTVLPNPKLREWNLSSSERTCNMLKNLERTHWITSYQMDYTGSGPANPLKIDDFNEKMSDPTGINSHFAPLREKSFPVFVPSKPRMGCRRREGKSNCSPTTDELPDTGTASATVNQHSKVQFDESPMSQSSQEDNAALIANTERPLDLYNRPPSQGDMEGSEEMKSLTEPCVKNEPSSKAGRNVSRLSQSAVAKDLAGIESHAELLSRAASEQEEQAMGRELAGSISNPCILPRPAVLPGIHSMNRVGTVGREYTALSLLDLQNSFSKSMAHRRFNSSITHASVNLRDNVVTGKKHKFYGINCFYLHG